VKRNGLKPLKEINIAILPVCDTLKFHIRCCKPRSLAPAESGPLTHKTRVPEKLPLKQRNVVPLFYGIIPRCWRQQASKTKDIRSELMRLVTQEVCRRETCKYYMELILRAE
jgi:hypothetical protein